MFKGNPLLRSESEKINLDRAQCDELIRCSEDIIYFANTYFYIVSGKGQHIIETRDYQNEILKSFVEGFYENRHTGGKPDRVVLSGRQTAKTTTLSIYIVWFILFHGFKTVAVLGNKFSTAREILKRIQEAYQKLPLWMQPGIKEWNKSQFITKNDNMVFIAATSSDGIRGKSIDLLALDEFSFIRKGIAQEFIDSTLPVVESRPQSQILYISTPFGINHFYDIWKGALKGTTPVRPIKIPWQRVPGRDEAWRERKIEQIGRAKFEQEYAANFLGSSITLVDASVLEHMIFNDTKEPEYLQFGGFLKIWKKPERNRQYALGCDSGKGIGKDYSVVQILDITDTDKMEQVGCYRNNTIPPKEFAQVIKSISQYYNNAWAVVESNNDMGGIVTHCLYHELEFEYMSKFQKGEKGIKATSKSKSEACMNLRFFLESGKLTLRDQGTLTELLDFTEVRDGIFRAASNHDDLVCALYWALHHLESKYYEGTEVHQVSKEKIKEYNLFDAFGEVDKVDSFKFGFALS